MICRVYGESIILRPRGDGVQARTFDISAFRESLLVMGCG